MIRRLFLSNLPHWAQPQHPVLRYQRGRTVQPPARVRYLRALGVILLGALMLGAGYVIATGTFNRPAGQNWVEIINHTLYFPALALQVLARVIAVALTSGTVADEIRRQNWDNLRATERGAELTLRSRWASVFYRLRGLIGVILVVRFILIACLLWDLTAFQGKYIDLLISGITPDISVVMAILLLAGTMTAAIILPITGIGFDASVGALISSLVQTRAYSMLLQFLWLLFRVGITIVLSLEAARFLSGALVTTDLNAWLLMGGYGAIGDWSLSYLNLGKYAEVWATVPYSIFFGLALMIFAIVQAFAADQLLALAVRRAQKRG
jgi:hypothetical protein